MTTTRTAHRLIDNAREYASSVWGMTGLHITADHVLSMELRSDGYANAHVEGEHEANGICSFRGRNAARDCGEAAAAAELIETTDADEFTAPVRTGAHAACDHESTKAARAACRRVSKEK